MRHFLPLGLLALAGWITLDPAGPSPAPAPLVKPCPPDGPCPLPPLTPEPGPDGRRPRRPWLPLRPASVGASVGGAISPDGEEIQCDLPARLHRRNINSRGLGCCVFRSLDHAARYQNVPALHGFPEWMLRKGIAGGGWPQKVDELIPKIAKDRGLPTPDYLQVEGGDLEILKLACRTGRMPCVTYSYSPSGRYGGARINHMVNLVHATSAHFAVLDNNYIDPPGRAYEWLTPAELRPAYTGGRAGWAVILLAPPPPPSPRN